MRRQQANLLIIILTDKGNEKPGNCLGQQKGQACFSCQNNDSHFHFSSRISTSAPRNSPESNKQKPKLRRACRQIYYYKQKKEELANRILGAEVKVWQGQGVGHKKKSDGTRGRQFRRAGKGDCELVEVVDMRFLGRKWICLDFFLRFSSCFLPSISHANDIQQFIPFPSISTLSSFFFWLYVPWS